MGSVNVERDRNKRLWEGANDEKKEENYKSNPVCDADIVQCIGERKEEEEEKKNSAWVSKSSQTSIIQITKTSGHGSV